MQKNILSYIISRTSVAARNNDRAARLHSVPFRVTSLESLGGRVSHSLRQMGVSPLQGVAISESHPFCLLRCRSASLDALFSLNLPETIQGFTFNKKLLIPKIALCSLVEHFVAHDLLISSDLYEYMLS